MGIYLVIGNKTKYKSDIHQIKSHQKAYTCNKIIFKFT